MIQSHKQQITTQPSSDCYNCHTSYTHFRAAYTWFTWPTDVQTPVFYRLKSDKMKLLFFTDVPHFLTQHQSWSPVCSVKNGFKRWGRVRSNGTTTLNGEGRSTGRKTCPGTTMSPTNSTWTGPSLIPGSRGEMPATNSLSHGRSLKRLGGGRRRGIIFCPVLPEFRKTTLLYLKLPRLHSLFLMITLKFTHIRPTVYIKIQSLYQSKQTPFPLKTAFSCSGR